MNRLNLWGKAGVFCAAVFALFGLGALHSQAAPLTTGIAAPNFSLPDQNGKVHTLAQNRGHIVILAFYPADFTSGCTIEAHVLSSNYPSIAATGAHLFGISVQSSESHKAFCAAMHIPYTLLADTQKTVAAEYGVLMPQGFADRVTYIIGTNGKIDYVDSNVNGHLLTCGPDWVVWIKAHQALLHAK